MRRMDEQYLATSFYGSRRMDRDGHRVDRKPRWRDSRQLTLDSTPPVPPAPHDTPWPEHQIDLEVWLSSSKETQ